MNGAEIKSDCHGPLVPGAALVCAGCGARLCLRKQVVNLALGHVDRMWCLTCLSLESGQSPAEILSGLKAYIQGRDCFRKEWVRYESVEYCPDRQGCLPGICFGP